MSEAPRIFDWTETNPLDVEVLARHLMQVFNQEFRNQADYNGIRAVRYDPNSKLQERVLELVQQFDGMRTEVIKVLKQQVIELNAVTVRPPFLMKLEDVARPFVDAERERCIKITEKEREMARSYGSRASLKRVAEAIREGK